MEKYPQIDIKKEKLDTQIVRIIPEEVARKYKVIALSLEDNFLCVAMDNPMDLPVKEELKLLTGFAIKPSLAPEKDIVQVINQYYKVEESSKQVLIDMQLNKLKDTDSIEETVTSIEEEARQIENIPVARLVNDIINGGINSNASDIHLEPQENDMIVRYRVDGLLHDIMIIPKHIEAQVVSRIKVLSNMDITERRKPQDGHVVLQKEGKEYDLRVSSLLTISGEKMVMRVFDKTAMLIGLKELGFNDADEVRFQKVIDRPFGMILIVGPTGSGKTTTLYAVLQQLNSKDKNIITIENPVEYKIGRINQIQVDSGANMTFATGLRTMLRQDPDIIMVGEIRDKETVEVSIQAALTGHLVLSTLHTNDAASAVTRLIDMGIEPFLISSTIIGCMSQRLCRKICSECAGSGCASCYNTGYKGRAGIFELMVVSEKIRNHIIEKSPASVIKKIAVEEGMMTLEENGKIKVEEGVTTLEEIKRVVYSGI